jgi:shikimate 5-dehydrogenase
VNTTSVHFDTFIDQYNESTTYFDLKYYMNPVNTKNYIDGKEMMIYGGGKSFELWTGINAPLDVMRGQLF